MSQSPEPSLQKRVDDFSYQVSSRVDPRFWFRLVREDDHDRITDYFLGSFPRERAGALLADCYRLHHLLPMPTVIFTDILPTTETTTDAQALDDARNLYLKAGSILLMGADLQIISHSMEHHAQKYDLIITCT
jgi:hypothetical protein